MEASSTSAGSSLSAMPMSGPSAGQIPDLLKIGAVPVNTAMDVETSVLDPVIQNDRFIRFTLQNKGILHSHSKIQFALSNASSQAYLHPNVGIAGLFQRATLKVGNTTICEIDDFAHFTAYRSLFMSNETSRERLQYQTGQMMSKEWMYLDEGDLAGSTANGGGQSSTEAVDIGVSNGLEYDVSQTTPQSTVSQVQMPNYLHLSKSDTHSCPTFQWSLSDFFPFLKVNQLPLYMMREQINLEFVLSEAGSASVQTQRAFIDADTGSSDLTYSLDTTKTKMFADYIYYPQEMMISYQQANPRLDFSYVDYRLSKLHVAGTETGTQIRNLGGAGLLVSKVMWGIATKDGAPEDSVLGDYNATAVDKSYTDPPAFGDTIGTATMNVKYNDRFLYPIDVDNNARHFHNVVQAEGLVPFVSREEYSNEGVNLPGRKLVGYAQDASLQGKFFWCASQLNRAERINSRGVELYFQYATPPTEANGYDLRAYVEHIKTATLEQGYLTCYNA